MYICLYDNVYQITLPSYCKIDPRSLIYNCCVSIKKGLECAIATL